MTKVQEPQGGLQMERAAAVAQPLADVVELRAWRGEHAPERPAAHAVHALVTFDAERTVRAIAAMGPIVRSGAPEGAYEIDRWLRAVLELAAAHGEELRARVAGCSSDPRGA